MLPSRAAMPPAFFVYLDNQQQMCVPEGANAVDTSTGRGKQATSPAGESAINSSNTRSSRGKTRQETNGKKGLEAATRI